MRIYLRITRDGWRERTSADATPMVVSLPLSAAAVTQVTDPSTADPSLYGLSALDRDGSEVFVAIVSGIGLKLKHSTAAI